MIVSFKMQSAPLFRYGAVLGFLLLIALSYLKLNGRTPNKAIAEADYLLNDQEFFENQNSIPSCNCSLPLTSINYNQTFVLHGENSPVFVPESLTMPPDILDKIEANKNDDGSVMMTIANYPMRRELYNWIEWIRQAQEEKFVIFCLDSELYLHLMVAGYQSKAILVPDDWWMGNLALRESDVPLLDDTRLSHSKTWILQKLAYLQDTNVMMLDVNQVMLSPRTREYIQTLLTMRSDTHLIATQDSSDQHVLNTGLMMIRGGLSDPLKRLLAHTIQIQEALPHLSQQEAFNLAMAQMELNVKSGMIVLLDMIHFPNGRHYFESKRPKGIEPFIVHVNHKVGESRIELLQAHQFWKPIDDHVDSINRQVEDIYAKHEKHLEAIKVEQEQSQHVS
ncbi:hypothetical protein BD560DRAFT_368397 [Blakeslea trispora]|nr:hypothetical protein BD560DRAFT_368397 [Blakeslea trispora]